MPFILIIVGVLLFVTAIRGTTGQLASMLAQDVFGTQGFVVWFVAVIVVGAIGYIKPLKGLSDAFLLLLIIVLFLSNRGFFAQFNAAIKSANAGLGVGTTQATGSQSLQGLTTQAQGYVAGGAAGL